MILPTAAQVDRRLAQMLVADSAQTGESGMARLMLQLTRSCELRCSYCFVALEEAHFGVEHPGVTGEGIPAGDMSCATARRAVDWLTASTRPRLGIQLFGGEPARRWDTLVDVIGYAETHPARGGRPLEVLFTTNGLGLDPARLATLRGRVTIQLSVDGWGEANRFRRPHLLSHGEAAARWGGIVSALTASGVRWFLNVTVPPAAAGELPERYRQAREMGVPALQLNYATGMRWSDTQVEAYLRGLWEVFALDDDRLYNWRNTADPAPLCGDVIADVDGTLLQVGGIFHERRFPALRAAYRHGHLDDGGEYDARRAPLAELWRRTQAALTPDEAEVFLQGMRLGAASDIVARLARQKFRGGR